MRIFQLCLVAIALACAAGLFIAGQSRGQMAGQCIPPGGGAGVAPTQNLTDCSPLSPPKCLLNTCTICSPLAKTYTTYTNTVQIGIATNCAGTGSCKTCPATQPNLVTCTGTIFTDSNCMTIGPKTCWIASPGVCTK
jgi:hypothetical protein